MVYFKVNGGNFYGGDVATTPAKQGLKYAEDRCSQISKCNTVSHGDNEQDVYWLKHIQSSSPGEYYSDLNIYVNMNKVGNHLVFQQAKDQSLLLTCLAGYWHAQLLTAWMGKLTQ